MWGTSTPVLKAGGRRTTPTWQIPPKGCIESRSVKVALCTRNDRNPVVRLLARELQSAGESAEVLTDPRRVACDVAYDVGFWRPDSRNEAVAAFARQVPLLLEAANVPFVNSLASCDRAWNKYVASRLFEAAGLQTPATRLAPKEWDAASPSLPEGPVVAKPVEGKASRGVVAYPDLDAALAAVRSAREPYVLQQAIAWTELLRLVVTREGVVRFYVQPNPGGSPSAAVARFDRERAEPTEPVPEDAAALADAMLAAVDGDLMRADVLRDSDGALWALEVNASFGFPHGDRRILDSFVRQFRAAASRGRAR